MPPVPAPRLLPAWRRMVLLEVRPASLSGAVSSWICSRLPPVVLLSMVRSRSVMSPSLRCGLNARAGHGVQAAPSIDTHGAPARSSAVFASVTATSFAARLTRA
jgi:hypothetical protein